MKIGDKLIRLLGGQIPMEVFVESIDESKNTFMTNRPDANIPEGEGWTFCSKTGMEIDPDLGWGPMYGKTGSYIKDYDKT